MRVLFPSLLKFRAANYRLINKRHKYIVLLPEIPPDTAETNPLLRKDVLPPFSQINVETCVGAIGRLVIEYESGIHHLDQKLYDPNFQSNVQNVILPLDRLSGHLDFVWGAFKILYTVQRDDRIANAYTKLHARIVRAKRERYLSASIYKAFKELKKNVGELTEPVRRIIDKQIIESRLSGMDLTESQYRQFQEIIFNLDKHRALYKQKLLQSTEMFSHNLSYSDVENLPDDLLEMLAGDPSRAKKGPWTLTLQNPHIYKKFMEWCDKRELRWNTWNAWNIRATSISGKDLNNSVEIEEIRYQRQELSKLLGFPTFADLSMQTKMAGSVDNVRTMITTLHVNCKDAVLGEIETLQAFAREHGFTEKLELWDISYWQRLHKEALFSIDDAVVRHYFPFPHVLNSLFQLFKKLFRINIKQVEGVEVWHKDVSYYKIYDENDKEIASFFMDPYFRQDGKNPGCWLEVGNNRSDVTGVQPLSYVIFNFFPPSYGRPSLLSFNDVKMLMRKFGHLLQHSLTEIPYSDVSGLSNLEWDVVNVCPLVMESFLRHYSIVAKLSSHVDSGEVLPADIHENIIESDNYMRALKLTEELYLSALDLELYSCKDFWLGVTKKVWSDFMLFPYEKHFSQPCSFPEIFSDVYPAAYFSNLWAKMIAADVFSVFEECNFEDEEKLQKIGMRFRETYLASGGGSYPGELFRKFCGRDPSANSLLASYGLTDKKNS